MFSSLKLKWHFVGKLVWYFICPSHNSELDWGPLPNMQKRPWHMASEILVLGWNRNKNVAGLNRVFGTPTLPLLILNDDIVTNGFYPSKYKNKYFFYKTNDQLNCHMGTCSKFLVYFVLNRRNKLYFQLSGLLLCNHNVFISVQPGSKA